MVPESNWINANWPAPSRIHAGTTLRLSGLSQKPYHYFNLAEHVGDELKSVHSNRLRLLETLHLPTQPFWLQQVHSKSIADLDTHTPSNVADGSTTTKVGTVCAVMTADCLPLLLCNPEIPRISAIHVGWRGFCQGIVAETIKAFKGSEENTLAWIGPCISAKNYEVRSDMMELCVSYLKETETAFMQKDSHHWFADMAKMVVIELKKLGINSVYGNEHCTFDNDELFYSYRRDGVTGRMATLIWLSS